MKERVYVEKILSGNTSAFAYFVNTYQGMAINIAYRICKNMQDAEDVVQESFVKAYKNLHTFRLESKFSTWFYRIVFNTAVTHTKAKMWVIDDEVESVAVDFSSDLNTGNQIEINETSEIVSHVLSKMPNGYGLMLSLFYLEDNSVKEVAEITGLNISNVKVMLFRARKMFKELMTKNYPELDKEEMI
ncbi:MAG: sigma-70 family RNA polymerase sigma factor [Dysgonamonadaceae bacterium]|nr:sigma-70 family RNA polymerase sigma factor [Dysgonamonadaceae bacterium]MDD4727383.1 sigma-70 family RNA polymerase sigma factor [Dysgonamonadaceae bacterium]